MKLEPVGAWMNGIAMLHRRAVGVSGIVLPSTAKNTTRCFLIEEVSQKAREAGYEPGQIVVAQKVWDLLFYGGAYHRATFDVDNVMQRVHDVALEEFDDLAGRPITDSVSPWFGKRSNATAAAS